MQTIAEMRNPMKFGLILWIFAVMVWSCAGAGHAATKLTIGYSTINPRIAPLWIAQEKGYFQRYGIDATLVYVRSTPLLIAAMKSGSIPVAFGAGSGILNASVGESDLKILATFVGKMTNNFVARPGIKTAKDLRGKIVGVAKHRRHELDGSLALA